MRQQLRILGGGTAFRQDATLSNVADIAAAATPRKVMAQVFSPEEACRHARITSRQLASWQRQGIFPQRGEYMYQDVVSLRALAQMKEAGLSPKQIRLAHQYVQQLEQVFGKASIVRRGRRTVARVPGRDIELFSGQMQLTFDAAVPAAVLKPRPKEDERRRRRQEAEAWFQRGLELEQTGGTPEEILKAYLTAIELDEQSAGAYVNVGTLYFNRRMWRDAEKYYLKAVDADPNYPLAHFNLGNLYDERGDRRRATHHYEEALRLKPAYGDAHYNLALLYQGTGQVMKALKHWRTYLKIDPQSAWASIARREMKKLQQSMVGGSGESVG